MSSSEPSTPDPLSPAAPAPGRNWGVALLWVLPALALVLVLAYGFLTRQPPDSGDTAPRIGKPLADFTLPDLQGRSVQLAALRGKVVFVNVWATWCPPCVEEMPTIQQLYERLHGRGLEILAVSLDNLGAQIVVPFMQSRRLSFPTLLDTKNLVQRLYRTTGVPESFVVDKRGILVEKVVGPRDWVHPQIIAQFERLLAMPVTN
jgi:cytochrome c biogenesis protein CcmG/thiol:disulfide interchange protein DsbE